MAPIATRPAVTIDLTESSTREVNALLASPDAPRSLTITKPRGAHALACGLDAEVDVTIDGDVWAEQPATELPMAQRYFLF